MTKKTDFLNLNARSAKALSKNADEALRLVNRQLAAIISVPRSAKRTSANTFEPLNQASIIVIKTRNQASLFAAVHPDSEMRKAAERSVQKLAKLFPAMYLRQDLYQAVKDVSPRDLNEETKRFREKELLDFKLTGVEKSPTVRREIKKLIDQGVQLGQSFDRNIKDDTRFLTLPMSALEGLPEDYRKAHPPNGKGMVRISTQYPDFFPFAAYAKDADARRRLSFLYLNRGWPKNEKVLKELLAVRRQQAKLLEYKNWADYITADKMVGSAKTVSSFLDRVARLAKKPAKRDLGILLARKRKDHSDAAAIETWEVSYYENLIIQEQIGLDTQEAREYFPFTSVKKGVLKTTEKLFGLSYRRASVTAWHTDVEVFDVHRGKKLIGRFYLDLHPRKNKYGHAACFDIRPGIRDKQLPEAALICNFSKNLMSHDEVETFFHEFGHLVHFILGGDARWARFSGFATEWDFVEAPSQMLEAWALDFRTLKTFARHHKTKKPIPEKLVGQMRKAQKFGKGIWQERQTFLSALSLEYHQATAKRIDLLGIMQKEQRKYTGLRYPEGTHFYAGFGHLNGYSAVYYTYTWSRAIAEDILLPFKQKGMQNQRIAQRYAEEILMPGGSKDARELIHNFLGRDWNLNAFRQWLGK